MKRYAGVLLPVTSLPSKYGIGCFDQAAYDFVDWLQKAGQRYWQILPLGTTSYGSSDDSPYQAYSAFAGTWERPVPVSRFLSPTLSEEV